MSRSGQLQDYLQVTLDGNDDTVVERNFPLSQVMSVTASCGGRSYEIRFSSRGSLMIRAISPATLAVVPQTSEFIEVVAAYGRVRLLTRPEPEPKARHAGKDNR